MLVYVSRDSARDVNKRFTSTEEERFMQTLIRGWLTVALLALVASVVVAADKVDIVGKYKASGTNPDGKTYEGTVEIAKKGDAYTVDWKIGDSDEYKGIGILEGDVLSVSYYGGVSGVVSYKIEKGPKLVGKWTFPEAGGKLYTETLTK